MNLSEYLGQMFDYTYWANKRYLAVAEVSLKSSSTSRMAIAGGTCMASSCI